MRILVLNGSPKKKSDLQRGVLKRGKWVNLFLLTRPLGHSLEYRMWKGD